MVLSTAVVFAILILLGAAPVAAQPSAIVGANVQKIANGVITLMGYSLVPDVTTGSLSFSNAATGSPGLSMSSLGAGFTVSKDFPLYLEGTAAYSRYDPTFLVSDGTNSREVPVKWNSLSATAGIGWDFPIIQDLVFRPIFNFTMGTVQSDLKIAGQYLGNQTGQDLSFLDRGRLDAAGIGGSLMLDYERYRPENEIDVELRYTNTREALEASGLEKVVGRQFAVRAVGPGKAEGQGVPVDVEGFQEGQLVFVVIVLGAEGLVG